MESRSREKIGIPAEELEDMAYCPDCQHKKCAQCVGVSVDVEGPWEKLGVNEKDTFEIPREILDKVVYCCGCKERNHFIDWMMIGEDRPLEEPEKRWSLPLREFAQELIARLAEVRGGSVSEKDFDEWTARWVISERSAIQAGEMIKLLAAKKPAGK